MKRLFAAALFLCLLPSAVSASHYSARWHGLPWCGQYMAEYFGIAKRSLWVAANWAYEGVAAGGPRAGVVAVWRHHVGVLVGQDAEGRWLLHSGNDGNAVRTRPVSLAHVIAFRDVGPSVRGSQDLHNEVQEEAPARRHKHLVALAVEGRVAARLKKSRAAARVASLVSADAFTFASPTHRARKVLAEQSQAMSQGESVFMSFFQMDDAVHAGHRKVGFSRHGRTPSRSRV